MNVLYLHYILDEIAMIFKFLNTGSSDQRILGVFYAMCLLSVGLVRLFRLYSWDDLWRPLTQALPLLASPYVLTIHVLPNCFPWNFRAFSSSFFLMPLWFKATSTGLVTVWTLSFLTCYCDGRLSTSAWQMANTFCCIFGPGSSINAS